ncbi:recombinase family protein [Pseudonocardia sp. ICBG601]|uniref:recombinase family protein n=1 Tax=Pseudonocardia sp. ICBG601 TaxID=2846759 RepID=UPI001CF68972
MAHPVEAEVVRRIFRWRVGARQGYQAIADTLNADPELNPPPTPVDPSRAVGTWTASSVREILNQPKYTGYMVWNRRAMRTRRLIHKPQRSRGLRLPQLCFRIC